MNWNLTLRHHYAVLWDSLVVGKVGHIHTQVHYLTCCPGDWPQSPFRWSHLCSSFSDHVSSHSEAHTVLEYVVKSGETLAFMELHPSDRQMIPSKKMKHMGFQSSINAVKTTELSDVHRVGSRESRGAAPCGKVFLGHSPISVFPALLGCVTHSSSRTLLIRMILWLSPINEIPCQPEQGREWEIGYSEALGQSSRAGLCLSQGLEIHSVLTYLW